MSSIFKDSKNKNTNQEQEIVLGNAELERNCEQEVEDNG